ncbi:tRNA (guanine-N(1)-)-methyltransferase [Oxobacter pfennigii]|uniref:tRNA (guanine-N(1)-)-methyltransferase n=1 Tax=Oxobacter pfennigii TaxID=36849 RepID=A0A0P8W860_9CLOT|nr:tRNA (guanosine(37)-N1)-methyltransferase TrmD [Oxobacter pfennigii]KPU43931.1 tRNA (guanine-N(1)-)-methyltransferase [Oxobacter pfennigii]
MVIDILTLFPEMFSPLEYSIIKRARDKDIIKINLYNIRDFTLDKHNRVDDYPYGGGSGMVMMADPIYRAMEHICRDKIKKPRTILMTPGGEKFNQGTAKELAKEEELIFICGHYEGIDERIMTLIDCQVSIGDYVITGGELAAMVVIDSVSRMVPGVLSSKESYEEESFFDGLLEYPQYTRPEIYRDMKVPEVLLSGHHENVNKWRRYQSLKKTYRLRPDLIDYGKLSDKDKKMLLDIENEEQDI